ncbi:hypothetical protein J2X36_004258 [Methylobacterium sp. BE186]|uniref:hypothetical protein n=1 Tax=Methylobacterium sp. BE186 TaxID=2817715 RepID=UPI002866BB4C|nr:hypothetical protein [Methylobacterium sp. BE186]MDR7039482.1 hypothetical protein [Methylobacterium sp. BE186]
MTYSIVDHADGRFAVVAASASGSVYWRCGFLTLAEAERCVEDLRATMVVCGAPLVRWEAELPDMDLRAVLRALGPPFR